MSTQYVAQRVLKNDITGDDDMLRRISTAQNEGADIRLRIEGLSGLARDLGRGGQAA